VAAPSLPEKIVRLEEAFTGERLPHAFGGALALAYYATPRATLDIDVNVFVGVSRAEEVLALLGALGAGPCPSSERARLRREEQARIPWAGTPVDLFFAYDPFHESCRERRRGVPFGDARLHILSAEDLLVFKVLFDRDKDWRDIEEMAFALAGELDAAYVRHWIGRILEPEDARARRLEQVLGRVR